MFKLKYEKKEDIPADVVNFYIEKDGMFVLDIEGGVPDVQGLKSALESEKELKKTAEKELKKVQAVLGDLTPERITELIGSEEKLITSKAKTSEEMANREKQLRDKWDIEDKAKAETIKGLNADIEEHVTKSMINSVIATLKGDPEVLFDPIRKSTKTIRKEGGGFGFQILDAEGKVRVGDNAGADMTVLQRAEEFKAKKGFASAFPTSTGSNANGSDIKNNGNQNPVDDKRSPTEKLKAFREQNN